MLCCLKVWTCCLEDQKDEFKIHLWDGLNLQIAASRLDQSGSFRVIGRTEGSQVIKRISNGARTVFPPSLLNFKRFGLFTTFWLLD